MTTDRLQQIISEGESLSVEFKGESHAPLSDDDLIEAIVCLANRDREPMGWLLIGVEDDGTVTGARPRHVILTDPNRLAALIANRTRPPFSARIEVKELNGKNIIVIEVPRSNTPISTSSGKSLRRLILGTGRPGCQPMSYPELLSRESRLGKMDISSFAISDTDLNDIEPLELARLRQTIREFKGDAVLLDLRDEDFLKALGMIEITDGIQRLTMTGLLLAGREETLRTHLPTHEVAFQVLRGLKVEVNNFYRLPLIHIVEEFMTRFRAYYREEEMMMGLYRVGVPNYPERAFREALINALIHRDYTQLGAIHVQWYDDHIDISNPGGFIEGVNLQNILVAPPKSRNPRLADAFKRLGLVERTARGIDMIFYECLRNGRSAPSYFHSTDTNVVIKLPGGTANLNFVRFVIEEERQGHNLSLEDLLILNQLCAEGRTDVSEVSQLIQRSENDAHYHLERLVELGFIETRGEKQRHVYILLATIYRRLGQTAAYTESRVFDTVQMEQMILQYIKSYKHISRKEAAELCQITERQATYLLGKMVKAGKIRTEGERRWTQYLMS